jgi:CRP-like cAMP-binding protein
VRLHRDSKIELLKNVPLFARCSGKALKQIAAIADEVHLAEGKELTRQGARGREFFVLVDGTADVRKSGRKVDTLGPGDFFGEIALVTHGPRTATVTTTSAVDALVITAGDFRTLLRTSSDIQTKVLEALAERLAPDAL